MSNVNSRTWNKQFRQLVNWNKYQLDIFDWVENGEGNALVTGVAGCGKSTTIIGALGCIKGKSQLVAFNTHIANHLKTDSRITKSRVSISTAHSLGLSLVRKALSNEVEVDNTKLKVLLKAVFQYKGLTSEIIKNEIRRIHRNERESNIDKYYYSLRKDLLNIVRKMQVNLYPEDITNVLLTCMQYGIDFPVGIEFFYKYLVDIPLILLEETEKLARKKGLVDYGDMLWLPTKWNITEVAQKDFFIVDEVQDASKAMVLLYKKYMDKGARGLFLGDPNQAIFGFAGSDVRSWDLLKEEFEPISLPLSYCYRCPTSHIALANHIVPNIEAIPNAPLGEIDTKSYDDLVLQVKPYDLIICRFTYPLISTCIKLLANQKVAYIKGLEIRDSLISIVNELITDNKPIIYNFKNTIEEYKKSLIEESEKRNRDPDELILDKISAVSYCYKEMLNPMNPHVKVESLKQFIRDLFDPKEEATTLSTIHRAKGDEADTVWILKPDALPYMWRARQGWEKQQEWNLVYVGVTRATDKLFFVTDSVQYLREPYGGMNIDYSPPKPMDLPIEYFKENWTSIVRNTPISDKWSYKEDDLGYRTNSNKAFCLYEGSKKKPKLKDYRYSTKNKPITWTVPEFNLVNTLSILTAESGMTGIDDSILLVPADLDALLVKTNVMYREDLPIGIAIIDLPDNQNLYNNHIIILDKDIDINDVNNGALNRTISGFSVIKVCEEVSLYDLLD